MPGHDAVELLPDTQDLARLDVDVGRLPLGPAERLMDHDARVGEREALALLAGAEQERAHARRLPQAERRDRRPDILHGVVDRETRGDRPAGRIHVEVDVLLRVLGLQKEHLRDHQVGDLVGDLGAQKHDTVLQEPREDVVGTLASTRLLHHHRNEDQARILALHPELLVLHNHLVLRRRCAATHTRTLKGIRLLGVRDCKVEAGCLRGGEVGDKDVRRPCC